MHGNMGEWVADCWNDSYVGAPTDGNVWTAGDCDRRIRRGGSWDAHPSSSRSGYRGDVYHHANRTGGGFRVARSLP